MSQEINNHFQIICMDPPYSFSDTLSHSSVKRGAAANYPTLPNLDIVSLNIKELADPNGCILALWVPSSLLAFGLDLMHKYGFEQKQTYIWIKTKKEPLKGVIDLFWQGYRELAASFTGGKALDKLLQETTANFSLHDTLAFGMGHAFRNTHEICLIGVNNNGVYKELMNKSQRTVSFAPNLKHSQKPDHLQNSLELMFPQANKLELFARKVRSGWTCLGNEVCSGEDIRDSIKKLLPANKAA